jgi:hypothetical protein
MGDVRFWNTGERCTPTVILGDKGVVAEDSGALRGEANIAI